MKTLKSKLFTTSLLALAILLANCKGEDGAVGPAGTNGTNGTNGTDGFSEATQDGKIVIYLNGTRPDGKAFKDTIEYKYSPTDAYTNSYAYIYSSDEYDVETHVRRFLAMDYDYGNSDESEDSYARIQLELSLINGDTTFNYFGLYINSDITFKNDHTFFRMDDTFESWANTESSITDFDVKAYKYDTLTGKLTYKFEFTSPQYSGCDYCGYGNSTGYDLKVSGYVDATVYRQYDNTYCQGCGGGRIGNKGSRISKPVTKAVMRDLIEH